MLIPLLSIVTAMLTGLTYFLQIESQHSNVENDSFFDEYIIINFHFEALKAFDIKRMHKVAGVKSFFGASLKIPFPRNVPSINDNYADEHTVDLSDIDQLFSPHSTEEIKLEETTMVEQLAESIDDLLIIDPSNLTVEDTQILSNGPSSSSSSSSSSSTSSKSSEGNNDGFYHTYWWGLNHIAPFLINLLVFTIGIVAHPILVGLQKWLNTRHQQWLENQINNAETSVIKLISDNDYKRAAPVAKATLSLITKYKGVDSDDSASFAHLLAKCELALGHMKQADKLLLQVQRHYEPLVESEPIFLARTLEDRARYLYEQWRRKCDTFMDVRTRSVELEVVFSTLQRSLDLYERDLLLSLGNQILESDSASESFAQLELQYERQLSLSFDRKLKAPYRFIIQEESPQILPENRRDRKPTAASSSTRSQSKTPPKARPGADESDPCDENRHPNSGKSSRSKSDDEGNDNDDRLSDIPTTIDIGSQSAPRTIIRNQNVDLLMQSVDAVRVFEFMVNVLRDNMQQKQVDEFAQLLSKSSGQCGPDFLDSKIPVSISRI